MSKPIEAIIVLSAIIGGGILWAFKFGDFFGALALIAIGYGIAKLVAFCKKH